MSTQQQPTLFAHDGMDASTRATHGPDAVERQAYYVTEVAVLLGIGRTTTYDLIRQGTIRSVRIGRRILVTRTEIDRLLETSAA